MCRRALVLATWVLAAWAAAWGPAREPRLHSADNVATHQLAQRTRQRIIRLCHAGLDARTPRLEILRALRTVVPIDAAFFATLDPGTLLFCLPRYL
jgi:hypothetical protein